MEFRPLHSWFEELETVHKHMTKTKSWAQQGGILRGNANKKLRETWQATMFAYAYSKAFELQNMSLKPEEDEYAAHDASLSWILRGQVFGKRIQLKELPPIERNAKITAQQLFDDVAAKAVDAKGVTFVLFVNRTVPDTTVTLRHWKYSGYWLFGFSKSDWSEMWLQGEDELGALRMFITRKPDAS